MEKSVEEDKVGEGERERETGRMARQKGLLARRSNSNENWGQNDYSEEK